MVFASLLRTFAAAARSAAAVLGALRDDRRGATAVVVAITLTVMAPLGLGLFDIYQVSEQHGKLQDALDAATLYAARSTATTNADIQTIGANAFQANLHLIHGASLQSVTFQISGSEVIASAQVSLPSLAPGITGPSGPVSVNSQVERAGKVEVALVLDNTGSMSQNNKLTNLQTAADTLIDKLVAASKFSSDPTPLKVSLVPFSSTVRVQGSTSLANYNGMTSGQTVVPSWLDPTAQSHWDGGVNNDIFDVRTDRFAILKQIGQPWAGCVESRPQPYDIQETPPDPSNPDTMFVPYFWPDEPGAYNSNASGYYNSYETELVGTTNLQKMRDHTKYTRTVRSGTNGIGFSYGPNSGCALQPVIRLTTDTDSVKTAIAGMKAVGETNIPEGMVWGWHTLSPNTPFADGAAYGTDNLRKVIVLMTDGQNTFTQTSNSFGSLYHGLAYIFEGLLVGETASSSGSQRTAAMDARLTALCSNIKAKNIVIYTVLVDSGTSSPLLQGCASSPDKFYPVSSSGLVSAFDAIADSIQNLRISK